MRVDAFRKQANVEVKLQQHRSIDVGDATLECTLRGSGAPVVLLANAGCSTGYFDHLASMLVTGGFQTISITHQSIIKTTFLLYKTAGRATAVG
jgi:hypothetical protein